MMSDKEKISAELFCLADQLYGIKQAVLGVKTAKVNADDLVRIAKQVQSAESLLAKVLDDDWW